MKRVWINEKLYLENGSEWMKRIKYFSKQNKIFVEDVSVPAHFIRRRNKSS
jgi:hypothetical protein